MLRKRIVVLDPQAGPFGFTSDRVKFHEQISHAIRGAFFKCVQTLFSSWPGTCDGWTREFPTLMIEKIASEESAIYSLFMARHYEARHYGTRPRRKIYVPIAEPSSKTF
uniref:Uncharacterized protein n=1 Tax=Triticum urartu TaxID=4572 RepID=A0A8R7RCA3_TRIUA